MSDGESAGVDHRIDMSPFNENVGAGDCASAKFVSHRGVHCVAWLLGLLREKGLVRLV